MKKYHLTVLGWFNNSDGTAQHTIECHGMDISEAGRAYIFYDHPKYEDTGELNERSAIWKALYPVDKTVITKIEKI